MTPMGTTRDRSGLATVLVRLSLVLLLGLLVKYPCASGSWGNGRPYRQFCYSDIVLLYRFEGLSQGKVAYFQARNEYPVLTGMFMTATGLPVRSDADFFFVNAALLSLLAGATTVWLYRMTGTRAQYFALSPTLLLYGFLNWDLLAVALATAGTYAFLRRRDTLAGIVLGLGAAAKLYPGLLLVPFALERAGEGERRGAGRLVLAGAGSWLVVNLPFVLFAFKGWSYFFRFSSSRSPQEVTLWAMGCRALTGDVSCGSPSLINVLSLLAFAGGSVLLWRVRAAREPDFPRWTFGMPLLVMFLLTNKVYSPQYDLWLLPWFALVLPDLRLFLAFGAAEVLVFFATMSWLAGVAGFGGVSVGVLQAASLLRIAVLLLCLIAYMRRPSEPISEGAAGALASA